MKTIKYYFIVSIILVYVLSCLSISYANTIGKRKKGYSKENAKITLSNNVKNNKINNKTSKNTFEVVKKIINSNETKKPSMSKPKNINNTISEDANYDNVLNNKNYSIINNSSNNNENYYTTRYDEIVKTKLSNQNINKTKINNLPLSSNVVISSDKSKSVFNTNQLSQAKNNTKNITNDKLSLTKNSNNSNVAIAKNTSYTNNGANSKEKNSIFSKYFGNSESRLKWFPGLYLNIGANILEDSNTNLRKMWSKLGLIPRFSNKDLSFAYDLTFYFDENNNIRKSDWNSIDDYIRKIYYIYYGKPGDHFTFKIEMIDDLTLGSGAIFRNYCGSLRYPLLDKKLGAVFKYDSGYDDFVKLFIDDIASPNIYGVSFEIMPHNHLQVGAQLISDNKVNIDTYDKGITVGSFHLGIPLKSKYDSSVKIYEEIAKIKDFGYGLHTGIMASNNDFSFKIEFRSMKENYIPNYFDTLYEMERHYKARTLKQIVDNGNKITGWFNEAKIKIDDSYTFRISFEKDYSDWLKPHLSLGIDYTGLEYNKLKISANYDRKNLYYSNTHVSDAIYGLKVRYDISDNSTICYEIRHILNDLGRPVDSVNIETQLRF